MSGFCWIDLDEAAVRLSSTPEGVSSLIEDGVLIARTFDGTEFVVRSDEVDRLAELFTFNKEAHPWTARAEKPRSGRSSLGRADRFGDCDRKSD